MLATNFPSKLGSKNKQMSCVAKIGTLVLWLLVILSQCDTYAQSQDLHIILLDKVKHGDAHALRDYASLLNDSKKQQEIINGLNAAFLQNQSAGQAISFRTASDFYAFYYPLRQILLFDYPLAAYFVQGEVDTLTFQDFSVRNIEITPSVYQQAADFAFHGIENLDTMSFNTGMQMLYSFPAERQDTLVLSLYERYISRREKSIPKSIATCFDRVFGEHLSLNDQLGASKYLLAIFKNKLIDPQLTYGYFYAATGAELASSPSVDACIQALSDLIQKYPDPVQMRIAGLEQSSGSSRVFFDDLEDFYGWVLMRTNTNYNQQMSLLKQLQRSQDPRSLFHLGTYVARLRWLNLTPNPIVKFYAKSVVEAIEQQTGTQIAVANSRGASLTFSDDPVWLLHYGQYWDEHWNDYLWDARKGRFSHTSNAISLEEEVASLFQLLASSNDSIALGSYDRLAHLDPSAVLALLPEYMDLIRSPNPVVPPLKKNFLYAAVALKDWGREYGLDQTISANLAQDIDALLSPLNIQERLRLENKIIATTSLKDLSILDIYLINRQLSTDASYSCSRILDQLYDRYWQQISSNLLLLRIYLKKATLFQRVQTTGSLHAYLKKIDPIDPSQNERLLKLRSSETDKDIVESIDWVLNQKPITTKTAGRNLTEVEMHQLESSILANAEPDFVGINAITMHPGFKIESEKMWLRALLKKWPHTNMLTNIALSEKLSAKTDIGFFETIFTKPDDLGMIWRWYQSDDMGALIGKYQSFISNYSQEEQGGYIFNFLRAEPVQQWLLNFGSQLSGKQEILEAINAWYINQDYLSEYDEGEVKLILLLIEFAGEPLANKLAVTCAIPSQGQKAFMQRAILASVRYSDLAQISDFLQCLAEEPNEEPVLYKTLRHLGLPPVIRTLDGKPLPFNKTLLESIVQGIELLGIPLFMPNSHELNYTEVQHILQYERVIPFVGGGGAIRDWYVFSTIKLLEQMHGTSLGFHPKLNEDQSFFTYNSTDRAEAWLKYLQEKGLIKIGIGAQSWQ